MDGTFLNASRASARTRPQDLHRARGEVAPHAPHRARCPTGRVSRARRVETRRVVDGRRPACVVVFEQNFGGRSTRAPDCLSCERSRNFQSRFRRGGSDRASIARSHSATARRRDGPGRSGRRRRAPRAIPRRDGALRRPPVREGRGRGEDRRERRCVGDAGERRRRDVDDARRRRGMVRRGRGAARAAAQVPRARQPPRCSKRRPRRFERSRRSSRG